VEGVCCIAFKAIQTPIKDHHLLLLLQPWLLLFLLFLLLILLLFLLLAWLLVGLLGQGRQLLLLLMCELGALSRHGQLHVRQAWCSWGQASISQLLGAGGYHTRGQRVDQQHLLRHQLQDTQDTCHM
jgi:hypothetical protein